jgi:hypothetical protein
VPARTASSASSPPRTRSGSAPTAGIPPASGASRWSRITPAASTTVDRPGRTASPSRSTATAATPSLSSTGTAVAAATGSPPRTSTPRRAGTTPSNPPRRGSCRCCDRCGGYLEDLRTLARDLRETDGEDTEEQQPVARRVTRPTEAIDAAITDGLEGQADAADEHVTAAIGHLEDGIEVLLDPEAAGYGDAAITVLVRRLRTAIGRAETARATALADR